MWKRWCLKWKYQRNISVSNYVRVSEGLIPYTVFFLQSLVYYGASPVVFRLMKYFLGGNAAISSITVFLLQFRLPYHSLVIGTNFCLRELLLQIFRIDLSFLLFFYWSISYCFRHLENTYRQRESFNEPPSSNATQDMFFPHTLYEHQQ